MPYTSESSQRLDEAMVLLDLPQELAQEAESEYHRIARWLGDPASPLADYTLNLYPQGSFRLGTPIRPITHRDEFDIDLVCQLAIEKERTTQAELKELVGNRLKADPLSYGRLQERRRCWTLFYKKKFHLDVLPTIPDLEHLGTGVLVTDTSLFRWQFSNPLGYAQWFYDRMRAVLDEARQMIAKARSVDIEDIPVWSVRTPLQRAVQVLKRHRDIHFQRDLDRRPVSIILTTLAARSYNGESDLAEALIRIIETMGDHIEDREGKWWVPNPAHSGENFADKWNEKPSLRDAFLRWRDQAYEDMEAIVHASNQRDSRLLVEKSLHGQVGASTPAFGMPQAPSSAVATTRFQAIPDVDSLTHRQRPYWPVAETYECSVSAETFRRSGAGHARMLVSRVPKGASLEFRASTDAPPPYEVFWQITNTGDEARRANCLRGGFERGKGMRGEFKTESTLYYGTHLVQAFVVKDGKLVARSREVRVRIESS